MEHEAKKEPWYLSASTPFRKIMVLARVQGFPFTWALYGVLQGFLKASVGVGGWFKSGIPVAPITCNFSEMLSNIGIVSNAMLSSMNWVG